MTHFYSCELEIHSLGRFSIIPGSWEGSKTDKMPSIKKYLIYNFYKIPWPNHWKESYFHLELTSDWKKDISGFAADLFYLPGHRVNSPCCFWALKLCKLTVPVCQTVQTKSVFLSRFLWVLQPGDLTLFPGKQNQSSEATILFLIAQQF